MSPGQFLTTVTIQVISDTHLTLSTLQEILTELDRLIPLQTDGQILSVSSNCSQVEALH